MAGQNNRYIQYLQALQRPFKKLTKLEFLNPDNSVAFSIGSSYKDIKLNRNLTNAFIQGGQLNVSTNNGVRRSATVTLSNLDGSFSYAVNKIWFGQRLRLSMGLVLPDGTDFYLPQGVFYIKEPQELYNPTTKTVSFPLVDKWAYLDGTLAGKIGNTFQITTKDKPKIFDAIKGVLQLSKYTYLSTTNIFDMIDNVEPVFTNYYDGKTYAVASGDGTTTTTVNVTDLPYDITENAGGNLGNVVTSLVECFAGMVGYDQTGRLRVDPSQDDISDNNKPILWAFTPKNSNLLGIEDKHKNTEVYNDIVVVGEGLTGYEVWGQASNYDPASPTNINMIGLKTHYENKAEYWNSQQCVDIAEWMLKRKTVLNKSVTIRSSQMFHLMENSLISVERTDKKGSPIERHLIESFSIPLGETGEMTINATSVNDFPIITKKQYSTQQGVTNG